MITGAVVVGCLAGATVYVYHRGASSVKPALAVSKGATTVAATNTANGKASLTAAADRTKVEVTVRAIERETGNVVAEARITGDINAAVEGWADGIDRFRALDGDGSLRSVEPADANADLNKRP